MDNVFSVTPIGNAHTKVYGSCYDTVEEAMKESYFYLCYVAGQEPEVDEAKIEYKICLSDTDDTETVVYRAHIKYVYNPKQKLIKEIKFLSFEGFPIDIDRIKGKSCRLLCVQEEDEWITAYPNLVLAMREAYKDWSRGYINFDVKKKMNVAYTTHGKVMFEADAKITWNGDGTKSIHFVKVRNIRKEEDKEADAEWRAFLKKMREKEKKA